MSSFFSNDDAEEAARKQAKEIKRQADMAAEQARLAAQASQLQREGMEARNRAEQEAIAMQEPAQEAPDVALDDAVPVAGEDEEELKRRRNPRAQFQAITDDGSGITI